VLKTGGLGAIHSFCLWWLFLWRAVKSKTFEGDFISVLHRTHKYLLGNNTELPL
jgi:hypothetical protein